MRPVLTAVLAAALPLSAGVQVPRDGGGQVAPSTGTAVIRGSVTDRETGTPIPRVTVLLSSRTVAVTPGVTPSPPRQAPTGVDGRYVFEGVPGGVYMLSFAPAEYKVAYLPQAYGASRPIEMLRPTMPRSLTVAEGQALDNIDIALWRSLAITGRIIDDLGDPLAGVPIVASHAESGQRAGSRGPYSISSDDRGAFRLFGLPPGRYVVCATPATFGGLRDELRERYVKTCAPSVMSEAEGQVVELTSGDFGDIEIRMQRGRAYRVTGTALDSQGGPVTQVSLVHVEGNSTSSSGTQADRTGHFTVGGLSPGEYAIRAEVGNRFNPADTREREVGYVPFRIDGSDVEGLVVTTARGATLTGRVAFEGAPPTASSIRITLRATPGQSMTMLMGPPPSAELKPDLTFTLAGVFGTQAVAVNGVPRGWIVKEVRLGDRDITDRPADFKSNDRLDILLSNRGAILTGRVIPAAGAEASDYRVVLSPAERERWSAMSLAGAAMPKPDGTFSLGPVRAGDYLIALVRSDDMPVFGSTTNGMELIAKIAQRVTLLEDDRQQIELTAGR